VLGEGTRIAALACYFAKNTPPFTWIVCPVM
jgi:hypothetical protein